MLFLAVALAAAPVSDDVDAAFAAARTAYDKAKPGSRDAFRGAFVDSRHALLGRTKDREAVSVTCPALRGSISTESCLREHLEHIDAESTFLEMEGDEVVSAVVLPGDSELFFTEGVVRGVRPDGNVVQIDLDVVRSRAPRDPSLEAVLFATVAKNRGAHDFSGPILSADARRALKNLPASFTRLDGDPSRRFVQEVCGAPPARIALSSSLLGQASFFDAPAGEALVTAISDVTKTASGIRVTLKRGKPIDITWPTPEKDVALRGDQAWAASPVQFPVHQAKGCPG